MLNEKSAIFRSEALRRYMSRNEKTIFPKNIAPRTFVFLWLVVGLLLCVGLCALFADIPMYASARALVVEENRNQEPDSQEIKVVLLLSPEYRSQLAVNQRVFFRLDRVGAQVSRQISYVEPGIFSASAVRSRFALTGDATSKVNESAVIAFIPLGPLPSGSEASSYLGTSYDAQVEIGHRRLVSLFPLVGKFFVRHSAQVSAQPTSQSLAATQQSVKR